MSVSLEGRSGPPGWRIAFAFIVSPFLTAASLVALAAGPSEPKAILVFGAFISVVGTYPAAIVVGLPTYCLLRRRYDLTPRYCALVGAASAIAPWAILWGRHVAGEFRRNFADSSGQDLALAVAWNDLLILIAFAFVGAYGGFLFWLVAAAGHPTRKAPAEA